MPINNIETAKCYGCGACVKVCPQHCIDMEPNSEGFLYPCIRDAKCIKCEKCLKVCPAAHIFSENRGNQPKAYMGVHKNRDIVMNSSSGGAFTAIIDAVSDQKQSLYVFGVCQDENLRTFHAVSKYPFENITRFRKSKYVQSNLDDSFDTCVDLLKSGNSVVFSGTPCQIYALDRYLSLLEVDKTNLITVDLVCYGVSSDKLLSLYLKKQKYTGVIKCDMRHKKKYWGTVSSKYTLYGFKTNRKPVVRRKSQFRSAYALGIILRESCLGCPFSNIERCSDFTIGDGWHIDEMSVNIDASLGCSLVICHSKKGNELIDIIEQHMDMEAVDIDKVIASQKRLHGYETDAKLRKQFLQSVTEEGFDRAIDKYVKNDSVISEMVSSCFSPELKKRIARLVRR